MLQYKLKKYYKTFDELEDDIWRIHPKAKILDDYFKIFVFYDNKVEKLTTHHYENKIEIVR